MSRLISNRDEPATGAEIAVFALFNLGLFVILVAIGARVGGDTLSYIEGHVNRPPIYVGLVALYGLLAGVDPDAVIETAYRPLAAVQILFGMACIWIFCLCLRRLYRLPYWPLFPAYVMLFSPYFFGAYRIGNSVQTEALTYPLYLIAFALLLSGLVRRRPELLFWSLALLPVLLLTRTHLLFVYPAFAVVLVYILWFWPERTDSTTKVGLALAFAASLLIPSLVERGYFYWRAGDFRALPGTGVQLVIAPLYLSTAEDVELYADDPEARALFEELRSRLAGRGLLFEDIRPLRVYVDHYYHHFSGSYNAILWDVVVKTFSDGKKVDWVEMEEQTQRLAWTWIFAHPLRFGLIAFHGVKTKLGGYYLSLTTGLIGLLALWSLIRRRDSVALGLCLCLLFHMANICAVAMVEQMLRRYTIYTEIPLALFLLLVVYGFFAPSAIERKLPGEPP